METNRDYISWSQYSLWKSSKLQFYKRYVLGEDGPRLPQFQKGKEFAEYRETGEKPFYVEDPLIEQVSDSIPIIGKPEKEIKVDFLDTKLLAYVDECAEDLSLFNEYKTGRDPWDDLKVQKHKQLDFYALCIYLLSGEKIIPKCNLYWIETEEFEVNGEIKLRYTGYVEKFEKEFTLQDIENMAVNIANTIEEIKNYVHEEIEVEEDLVERYIELSENLNNTKNELDIIKLRILDELSSVGAKHAVSKKGRFSISQRKTPIFSKELILKEKQYKKEIDELKEKEKSSPDIKYSITESIRFTKIK